MATVLIVEDDPSNLQLLRDLLTRGGYDVIATKNGAEALRMLRIKLPDILITDLMMPNMSGQELMALVRSNFSRDLPIIVISAASIPAGECQRLTEDLGMRAFFAKPYRPTAIADAVRSALALAPASA